MTNVLRCGPALLFVALLAGCATPVPRDFCAVLDPQAVLPGYAPERAKGADGVYEKQRIAQRMGPYAVISNNSYDRPQPLELPAGWRDYCDKPGANSKCAVVQGGAGFQAHVYVHQPAGTEAPAEIVFAYRGTTSVNDWLFGNLFDEQYLRANLFVLENLAQLERRHPGLVGRIESGQVAVVTTGHSLGGGLAEHTAYCFARLNVMAYSFNPSPRNHKHSCEVEGGADADVLRLARLSEEPTPAVIDTVQKDRILRIHQSQELLSPIRHLFSSKAYTDVDYRFSHGGPISRHGMTAIAMGLTKVAACPIDLDGDRTKGTPDEQARARYASVCSASDVPDPCLRSSELKPRFEEAMRSR